MEEKLLNSIDGVFFFFKGEKKQIKTYGTFFHCTNGYLCNKLLGFVNKVNRVLAMNLFHKFLSIYGLEILNNQNFFVSKRKIEKY